MPPYQFRQILEALRRNRRLTIDAVAMDNRALDPPLRQNLRDSAPL